MFLCVPWMLRKDTCTWRQGANLYNLFFCSFRIMIHAFFSLNPFRCNSNINSLCQGGRSFWCGIFWFFSQFGAVKLPYFCQSWSCLSGEGDEFIINGFLSWGLEWSWSVCLLSFSFKDFPAKATSPSKALTFPDSPCSCSAVPVQPPLLRPHLLIYVSELAEASLMMSLVVITDGIFAVYLFLPSAHLDSHWFCSVNNLTGYHCTFFFPIVPALTSLSQITLRRQGGSFVFLLTDTGFSWAGPKVQIRVLLRSCSEFCKYQKEGCWISLKTLPSTVVFQTPRLQRSLSQAGLSLSSSSRSCLSPMDSDTNPL